MLKTDEDAELKQIALTRIKLYNEEFSEELNRLKAVQEFVKAYLRLLKNLA